MKRNVGLTNREFQAVICLAEGLTAKDFSRLTGLTVGTSKVHIHTASRKLGVSGGKEIERRVHRLRMIALESILTAFFPSTLPG